MAKNKRRALGTCCEFPSKADLDWMETHLQRHARGFDAWWKTFVQENSGRDVIRAIVSVWEAGRSGKVPD